MTTVELAAASESAPSPWLFVLGTLAVLVVSLLGPLSRMHERRASRREEAAASAAVAATEAPQVGDQPAH